MPQATPELRARWSEETAMKQLLGNFIISRNGIIFPIPGYQPTDNDLSAIEYLFQEWDYAYVGNLPLEPK
jgi:hypothetical protein